MESNRRNGRIGLSTLASVEYYDKERVRQISKGRVVNANRTGICLSLNHGLEPGRVILIHAWIPFRYRPYDFASPEFTSWVLIRYSLPESDGHTTSYKVGFAFIGPRPPADFQANPLKLYQLSSGVGPDGLWRVTE